MRKISAIDKKILRAYQNYPDLPVTELAEKVDLSNTACWKRIKRMKDEGIILGKAVVLNQKSLGLEVTVVAQISLEKKNKETLDEFERAAVALPQIISCDSMSGDNDYVLKIVSRSIEDYEMLLRSKIASLPYVASINSSFVLKRVKNTTCLPV